MRRSLQGKHTLDTPPAHAYASWTGRACLNETSSSVFKTQIALSPRMLVDVKCMIDTCVWVRVGAAGLGPDDGNKSLRPDTLHVDIQA